MIDAKRMDRLRKARPAPPLDKRGTVWWSRFREDGFSNPVIVYRMYRREGGVVRSCGIALSELSIKNMRYAARSARYELLNAWRSLK